MNETIKVITRKIELKRQAIDLMQSELIDLYDDLVDEVEAEMCGEDNDQAKN